MDNTPISINKLCALTGLTSRTLRHWEKEGLFQSRRGEESGWREYDTDAVLCIHVTAFLRSLDIPIADIRRLMQTRSLPVLDAAVGQSPEDDALNPLVAWLEQNSLLGTARLFGYNIEPWPSEDGGPYGFACGATVPAGVAIPAPFTEVNTPGGLYASLAAGDDIGAAWGTLMQQLKTGEYAYDKGRPCEKNKSPTASSHRGYIPRWLCFTRTTRPFSQSPAPPQSWAGRW